MKLEKSAACVGVFVILACFASYIMSVKAWRENMPEYIRKANKLRETTTLSRTQQEYFDVLDSYANRVENERSPYFFFYVSRDYKRIDSSAIRKIFPNYHFYQFRKLTTLKPGKKASLGFSARDLLPRVAAVRRKASGKLEIIADSDFLDIIVSEKVKLKDIEDAKSIVEALKEIDFMRFQDDVLLKKASQNQWFFEEKNGDDTYSVRVNKEKEIISFKPLP
jgi:hypothetical protein